MDQTLSANKVRYDKNVLFLSRYLQTNFCKNGEPWSTTDCTEKAEKIYQFFGSKRHAIDMLQFIKMCNKKIATSLLDGI